MVLPINLVINFFIFAIFVPNHVQETEDGAEQYSLSIVARFVGGDYLSTLVWMAATNLMPLIIIEKVGPEMNAHFYLPWMITSSLYLVSRSIGMSLTVEAAKDPANLLKYSRQSLVQTAILLVPIVLIILVGAEWVLSIFGSEYAAEGAGLLRLLALSSIPNAIISLYVSIARVQRKVFRIAFFLTLLCILAITLTLIWLNQFGLTGIGMAWLASQTFVAGLLLFTEFRRILFSSK
jgi:O-antigen/teichoic acid export membrane protein